MKNAKSLVPVLAVMLCVSLSCTFLKDKFVSAGKSADEFRRIAKLSPPDPNAPQVSPGALAVRKLAEIDPGVSDFAAGIEATEREAIKKGIAASAGKLDANKKPDEDSYAPSNRTRTAAMAFVRPAPMPALLMFQAGDAPLPGFYGGVFVGMFTGGLKRLISEAPAGKFNGKIPPKTETSEGTTSTIEMEFGGSEDGSTVMGVGIKSESTKNGVKVTTEMQATIEGNDCPNAEGQVQMTVKMHLSARSGGTGYTQDVTAFIRTLVDDNANNSATTIDLTHATSRGKGGQEVAVETGETLKYNGGDFDRGTQSNARVIQKTDNAGDADVADAWKSGQDVAYGAAVAAIREAETTWKGGKCIQIDAKSPGRVEPTAGIAISVQVRHRKDGSEVAAKLDANLVGETSIDPTLIPKTPGTLMYVAPGDAGKTATINLKATSRRGIATLDLNANTGKREPYRVEGSSQGAFFKGDICRLDKPFTIDVDSKTGKWPMEFTPIDEESGEMTGTFSSNGCTLSGGGPYVVTLNPSDSSGTITFTYNSTATCPGVPPRKTSRTVELPLKSAPDLSCP